MEDVKAAASSSSRCAAERGAQLVESNPCSAAVVAQLLQFPQRCSSPRKGLEKQQKVRTTHIINSQADQQHTPHMSRNDCQSKMEQKQRSVTSPTTARQCSASAEVFLPQQLGTPSQQKQQHQHAVYGDYDSGQKPIQQSHQRQLSASMMQPVRRHWLPSLRHTFLSESAPLPGTAVGPPASLPNSNLARDACGTEELAQDINNHPGNGNRNGTTSRSSSSTDISVRCVPPERGSSSSLCASNNSCSGRTIEKLSSHSRGPRNRDCVQRYTSSSSDSDRARSSSIVPFSGAAAGPGHTMHPGSSPFLPDNAESSAAYQPETEALAIEQAAAESAAAAAIRSAARAAAASAAAEREAHAAAAAECKRSCTSSREAAPVCIEASRHHHAAGLAGVANIVGASRTASAAVRPATQVQRTRESVRAGCERNVYSNLNYLSATAEDAWDMRYNVGAAELSRKSAALYVKEDDTAVLTLSPDSATTFSHEGFAAAAAITSTGVKAACRSPAAVDSHCKTNVPRSASAEVPDFDASLPDRAASPAASSPVASSVVPALASFRRESFETRTAADPPSPVSRIPAGAPLANSRGACALPGVAAVIAGARDVSTAALELPLAWTAEDDQSSCTPRSSCVRASPRSHRTSCSQETEQQSHWQYAEYPSKEQVLHRVGDLPEATEQRTDENRSQEPSRQQVRVQDPTQQQRESLQAVQHRNLQEKLHVSPPRQLKHDHHVPLGNDGRHLPKNRQECRSQPEQLDKGSVLVPSGGCGDGIEAAAEVVCVEEQSLYPLYIVRRQVDTLAEEQPHPCPSSGQQQAQTNQGEQDDPAVCKEEELSQHIVEDKRCFSSTQDTHHVEPPRGEVLRLRTPQPEKDSQVSRLQQDVQEQMQGQQHIVGLLKRESQEEEEEPAEPQKREQHNNQQCPAQPQPPHRHIIEKEGGPSQNKEVEHTSEEQAAALRKLQHLVQQQQDQLQQLMQQQTLLLRQLQQQTPLVVSHQRKAGDTAEQLLHASVVRPRSAASPTAGAADGDSQSEAPSCSAAAVPAPAMVGCQEAFVKPLAVSAVSTETPKSSSAGNNNTSKARHETCGCPYSSGAEKDREEAELCFSHQSVLQPVGALSKEDVSKEQVREHTQQNRQCSPRSSFVQRPSSPSVPEEEPNEQRLWEFSCVKQLLQGEHSCQQLCEERRHTRAQNESPIWESSTEPHPLREIQRQPHSFEKTLNKQQQFQRSQSRRSDIETKELTGNVALLQRRTPPPLSGQVLVTFDQLSVMQGHACTDLTVSASRLPASAGDGPSVTTASNVRTARSPLATTSAVAGVGARVIEGPTAAGDDGPGATQTSMSKPLPATAAAADRKANEALKIGATTIASPISCHSKGHLNPPCLQQQRQRGRSVPADGAMLNYHMELRDSSSTGDQRSGRPGTSFSRLSTETESQLHVHDRAEQQSSHAFLLQQHSLPVLECNGGKKKISTGSPIAPSHVGLRNGAVDAVSAPLAANGERLQEPAVCTAELLRQQQWELQEKLREVQQRMKQLQHRQLQEERVPQQETAIHVPLSSPQRSSSTKELDSPVQQLLPFLLGHCSLQGIQQCREVRKRHQETQQSVTEGASQPCVSANQQMRRCHSFTSNRCTGLADSAERAHSGEKVFQQQAVSTACPSYATGGICIALRGGAVPEHSGSIFPPLCSRLSDQVLFKKAALHSSAEGTEAAAVAMKDEANAAAAAGKGFLAAEHACPTHAKGHYTITSDATAPTAATVSSNAQKESLAGVSQLGSVQALFDPAGACSLYVFPSGNPAVHAPQGTMSTVGGRALWNPSTDVPAPHSLEIAADMSCTYRRSSSQRHFEGAKTASLTRSQHSSSEASPNKGSAVQQIASAGAVGVECTSKHQQELQKHLTEDVSAHETDAEKKAGEKGEELGAHDTLSVSQQQLLQSLALQKPPFDLPGLQRRMQQQNAFQEVDTGSLGVTQHQGNRRILDQDEQIVPSVLKRLLLQQQQVGRGGDDGTGLSSFPSALQHYSETCWWEEAASSKSPVGTQQPRRQQQQQLRKRLPAASQKVKRQSSRSDGVLLSSAALRKVRPAGRLSSGRGFTRVRPSRGYQATQQNFGRNTDPGLCLSALGTSASNSWRGPSSTTSRDSVTKPNSNHMRQSGSHSKCTSNLQSSTGPATAYPSSPKFTRKKTGDTDWSRAKALQQRQCGSKQSSGPHGNAALQRTSLDAQSTHAEMIGKKDPSISIHAAVDDAPAVPPPSDSGFLASSVKELNRQHASAEQSVPLDAAVCHCKVRPAVAGSHTPDAALSSSTHTMHFEEPSPLKQRSNHISRNCPTPDQHGNVSMLPRREVCSSRSSSRSSSSSQSRPRHSAGPGEETRHQSPSRCSSCFGKLERSNQGGGNKPSPVATSRGRLSADKRGPRVDSSSNVENAFHESGSRLELRLAPTVQQDLSGNLSGESPPVAERKSHSDENALRLHSGRRACANAADLLRPVHYCNHAERAVPHALEEGIPEAEASEKNFVACQQPPPAHQQSSGDSRQHNEVLPSRRSLTQQQGYASSNDQPQQALLTPQQHPSDLLPQEVVLINQIHPQGNSTAGHDFDVCRDEAAANALEASATEVTPTQRSSALSASSSHDQPHGKRSPSGKVCSTRGGLLCSRGSFASIDIDGSGSFALIAQPAPFDGSSAATSRAYVTADVAVAAASRETAATILNVSELTIDAESFSLPQQNELPEVATATKHCVSLPLMHLHHQRRSHRASQGQGTDKNNSTEDAEEGSPPSSELLRSTCSAQRLPATSFCSIPSAATAAEHPREAVALARTRKMPAASALETTLSGDGADASVLSSDYGRRQRARNADATSVAGGVHAAFSSRGAESVGAATHEEASCEYRQHHSEQLQRQNLQYAQLPRENQGQRPQGRQLHEECGAAPKLQREQSTNQDPRRIHRKDQQKALQTENRSSGAAVGDGNDAISTREAAAVSADPYFGLLRFREVPHTTRQPRGQETAALVQMFLSQQDYFAAAGNDFTY